MKGKALGILVLVLTLLVAGVWGFKWITYRLNHAISNAAFVESDSLLNLAYKRTGGRVIRLFKKEGDFVQKGEVLAKLEDKELRLKLQETEHKISALRKEREALVIERQKLREELNKKVALLDSRVKEVESRLSALEVGLEQVEKDWKRFKELFSKGVVPSRRFEEIDTQRKKLVKERQALLNLKESLEKEREIVEVSRKAVVSLQKRIESLEERILAAEKGREDLLEVLEQTLLKAPFDGYVVKRFVNEGEVVRQGQYIYSLLNPEDVYVLVLLEENKLEGVKEGNKVYIKVDALPDAEYEGVVSVINMATAAKFALIPRDITAGEFTKVAQRVPVRVEITKGDKRLLRVGFGAEVSIRKRR